MEKLKVLDLFSGIGGFSLGLERTGGFETVAFCEIEKYPRAILAQHWPSVRIYENVKTLTSEQLAADGIVPDVICGGFPCQDISLAGKGAGLEGERSGLWFEYHRLIKEIRPSWVIAENVSALRSRGLDDVLRSLAEIGYDAEWHCIPASAVGAPHRRDRIWIVAYPNSNSINGRGESQFSDNSSGEKICNEFGGLRSNVADTKIMQRNGRNDNTRECLEPKTILQSRNGGRPANVADALREGLEGQFQGFGQIERPLRETAKPILGTDNWSQRTISWAVEPDVGRVAHGVSKRVDRLKALGNAVVPQIPELIGYSILENYNATA
jgi:DNA (cytosine-5)-methyltransferase 1